MKKIEMPKQYKNNFGIKMKAFFCSSFVVLFFAFLLFLPSVSFAKDTLDIVPCENDCTVCHIYVLIANVFRFMLFAATFLAILYVAWGGFLMLTSGASPGNLGKGKKAVGNAVLGLIIAFSSWMVVNTLIHFLLNPSVFPVPTWSDPKCN